ncbi:MAG: TonB family protein [Nitrospiraceae bacterium]|nr:TonB family protein [Nitrospiraceae bacterium]
MSGKKVKKKTPFWLWVFIALMVVLAGAGVYIIQAVLSGGGPQKKSFVTVTLLKPPPPPPPPKVKPPEPKPEIPKKEDIVTPQPKQESKPAGPQNKPAGPLGVVGKGTAGGDAFGLVARTGGRGITVGGGGGQGRLSALLKYAGYTRLVQNEIREAVLKQLNEDGVAGKFQTVVKLGLDARGAVTKCVIVGSSGRGKVDEAVKQTLSSFKLSEAPPDGMPRWLTIRIVSPG